MIRDAPPAMPSPLHPHRLVAATAAALAAAGLGTALLAGPVQAQQQGYGQTMGGGIQQQQLLENGPSAGRAAPLFNPANPLDLINQIRKGTALNDATPPGSAIDSALSEFEQQKPAAP